MEINNENRNMTHYFIATLHPSKKNSDLLDSSLNLKTGLKRNIDYIIMPQDAWVHQKRFYDVEIPAQHVYLLKMSFLCSGVSCKHVYVHGVETVFDVVITLFVNKMFDANVFRSMFSVTSKGKEIDPSTNFESLATDSEEIEIFVEKRISSKYSRSIAVENTQKIPEFLGVNSSGMESLPLLHSQTADLSQSNDEYSNFYIENSKSENERDFLYTKSFHANNYKLNERINTMERINEETSIDSEHMRNTENEECSIVRSAPISPAPSARAFYSKSACIGLPNLGNTCFMNSAIQCLNNCQKFAEYFINNSAYYSSKSVLEVLVNAPYKDVIKEWTNLLVAMNKQDFVSARDFKNEIGKINKMYLSYEEQDSFEFINNLLDMIHEGLKNHLNKINENIHIQYEQENLSGSSIISNELLEEALKKGFENDWKTFKAKNASIVADLFFGMSTNVLSCKSCKFVKYKNDPFMSLSLPIPSSVRYHSSVTVVFESNKPPIKILADLSMNVGELVAYTKREYQISDEILPIEYKAMTAISKLHDSTPLTEVKNRISLMVYRKSVSYFICKLNYKKMFIFNEKLPVDLLIEKNNVRAGIYKRLEPYFIKSLTLDELFDNVSIEIGEIDKVYNLPIISIGLSSIDSIFGSNLDLLKNIVVEKPYCISINDCLNMFLKEEIVSFSCENCHQQTQYSLQQKLTKLPKILIVQFKRFTYDKAESKINTFIDFPLDSLEIGSNRYKLIGSCNHIEIGMGCGHYLAYVLKEGKWFSCNDSVITACNEIDKRSAYVLFYERIDN